MPATEVTQNITLVAQNISPMNFGELWLVRNHVFTEDDMRGQRVATPVFSAVETRHVQLAVMPNQFQFSWKGGNPDMQALATAMTNLVNGAARTIQPQALGINFIWQIRPIAGDIAQFSRDRFRPAGRPFDAVLGGDAATWGIMASRSAFGGALSVSVTPAFQDMDATRPCDHLQAQFNYHFPVHGSPNPAEAAVLALGHAAAAHEESGRIAHSILDL